RRGVEDPPHRVRGALPRGVEPRRHAERQSARPVARPGLTGALTRRHAPPQRSSAFGGCRARRGATCAARTNLTARARRHPQRVRTSASPLAAPRRRRAPAGSLRASSRSSWPRAAFRRYPRPPRRATGRCPAPPSPRTARVILLDTNVLVALTDPRERLHRRAARDLRRLARSPLGVPLPVLTEACFLLPRAHHRARLRDLLQALSAGPCPIADDAGLRNDIFAWLVGYADHEPDWADGYLAVVCGRERRFKVWTYDREFRTIWRRPDGSRIP